MPLLRSGGTDSAENPALTTFFRLLNSLASANPRLELDPECISEITQYCGLLESLKPFEVLFTQQGQHGWHNPSSVTPPELRVLFLSTLGLFGSPRQHPQLTRMGFQPPGTPELCLHTSCNLAALCPVFSDLHWLCAGVCESLQGTGNLHQAEHGAVPRRQLL